MIDTERAVQPATDQFECPSCGHKYEIVTIPTACPACGAGAAPPKTEAENKADTLSAKFRLAANRAKGNF